MKTVETYKALTYRLLVYGFQPVDLVITLLMFVFVHGIISSLILDIIFIIIALIIAKKSRNRPDGYFISLALYLISPPRLNLKNSDIPTYRSVKDATNQPDNN